MKKLRDFININVKPYSFFDIRRPSPCVIAYFDENNITGLADRLRHCLSMYNYCMEFNYKFKIVHKIPFRLEKILIPVYDWNILTEDISNSRYYTKRIEIWSNYKSSGIMVQQEEYNQREILKKNINKETYQYKVVGNVHYEESKWKKAFDDLFKPNNLIINGLKKLNLPQSYDAVTLRFQQLLGDFKEGCFETLSDNEQQKLITLSINKIEDLYESKYFKNSTILVTSDSSRFLSAIKDIPFIKTIPGNMVHPGFSHDASLETYAKSFIDLFALRGASSITLLKSDKMYSSGFPEFAAKIGNNRFKIIEY